MELTRIFPCVEVHESLTNASATYKGDQVSSSRTRRLSALLFDEDPTAANPPFPAQVWMTKY